MEERRKYIRINKAIAITYQVLRDSLRPSSRSKDISEGGVRLLLTQRLEPETKLKLWLYLSYTAETIEIIAKVVWLNKGDDPKFPYVAGIKFIESDKVSRDKLQKYLSKISEEDKFSGISWVDF